VALPELWDLPYLVTGLKKIVSILLLGIMLFNLFGYRLLVTYMQARADSELDAQLDSESYDESALISVKVPVTHLSYYNLSTKYERVNGSIEIAGVTYQYVKRRLYNDSLEMLCIPNQTVNNLKAYKNEFFGTVNGLQPVPTGKQPGAQPVPVKLLVADPYMEMSPTVNPDAPCRRLATFFYYTVCVPTVILATDERPPSAIG
jgi:hypothetical protein